MTDTDATAAGWDAELPTLPRRPRWLVLTVAVVVLLGLGGGAAFAFAKLSGGGAQPETVLPASTLALARVDLDPAAGQKVAAYRLSRKFPHSGVGTDQGRAVGDLLRGATGRVDSGIDFDRDVRPWLGSRAALAAVPTGDPAEPVVAIAALACTDRDAMVAALDRVRSRGGATGSFGYRYRHGYVLIGEEQATVDAASTAAAEHPLSGAGTSTDDVAALGGDQIGVAWADLGAVYRALPAADRADAEKALPGQQPSGRYVVGLHVTDSSVEVHGRGFDLRVPAGHASLGTAPTGGSLVDGLPADGVAAGSVTGLGASVRAVWDALPADERGDDPTGPFGDLGIHLPDDLVGLFGSQTAVWIGADGQSGGLRARTPDGAVAEHTATTLLGSLRDSGSGDSASGDDAPAADPLGSAVVVRPSGGNDLVVATDRSGADAIVSPAHPLRDRPGFAAVAPDATTAGTVVWADLARLVQLSGSVTSAADRADLAPLDQLGCTATAGGDWPFRLRVTVH